MSTHSIISMVGILSLVIGGFVFFLSIAIRKESDKEEEADEDGAAAAP